MPFRNYLVKLVFQKYIDGYDLKIHPCTHTNTHIAINILEDMSEPFLHWCKQVLRPIKLCQQDKEYLPFIQRNKRDLFFQHPFGLWILGSYFLPAVKTLNPGTKKLIKKGMSSVLPLG